MDEYREFIEDKVEDAVDPYIDDYDLLEPSKEFNGSEPSKIRVTATSEEPEFNLMATYGGAGGHMNEYQFTARALLLEDDDMKTSRSVIRGLSEGEFPEDDVAEEIESAVSEIF